MGIRLHVCHFVLTVALIGTTGLRATPLFVDGVGADGNYHLFTYNNSTLINTAGLSSMGPPAKSQSGRTAISTSRIRILSVAPGSTNSTGLPALTLANT